MCLAALSASAESNNVALTCKNVTASYTSGWNNLYSVNNGTKGFGMDLPNEETWGCYISTAGNQSEQYITYTWDLNHRLESATVYFWSDAQSGSGVAVPESWEILYLDENGEWQEVTLLDGEQYGLERFEANSAAFVPVETRSIRLLLHAQLNGSNYSAMGVNEWEVYGECIEKEDIDPNAKVSVATYASSIEATYTSSWNNLNSINNGTKGFGMDLPNNETWGCWQNPNAESQSLTYWWEDDYSIDSVSVYFWSDSETGTGVVVPQSWFIEYYDNGNWTPVTLLDGEVYGTERLEANHVKFNTVSTRGLRLTMNAYQNEDGSYAAIGVNEWEVFGANISIIDVNNIIKEITLTSESNFDLNDNIKSISVYNDIADVASITYSRNFTDSQVGHWHALFVPFDIEMTAEVTEKCDIALPYMVATAGSSEGGTNESEGLDVMVLKKLKENDIARHGTPYFIRPKNAGEISLVQEETCLYSTLTATTLTCATTIDDYSLIGIYSAGKPTSGTWYAMGADGALHLGGTESQDIPALRWYMTKTSKNSTMASAEAKAIKIVTLDEDDVANAIAETELRKEFSSQSGIYSITGAHLSKLQKGLNIVNGKKVFIK